MRVYLVRHGKALSKEQDPQRFLSPLGRQEVRSVAIHLSSTGLEVAQIRHSGKERARQTAELLAAGVRHKEVIACDGLSPNDPVDDICRELSTSTADLMIVGHLPFMSRLASRLLGADEGADMVHFSDGAVLSLERTPEGRWAILWMLSSRIVPMVS